MPELSDHARELLLWFRTSGQLIVHGLPMANDEAIATTTADVEAVRFALEHSTYEALITGRDAAVRLYRLAEPHHATSILLACYQVHEWMLQQLAAFALLQW